MICSKCEKIEGFCSDCMKATCAARDRAEADLASWRTRAMELEAMVERMAGTLREIKELGEGPLKNMMTQESYLAKSALAAYAAMKGVPSASKEEI